MTLGKAIENYFNTEVKKDMGRSMTRREVMERYWEMSNKWCTKVDVNQGTDAILYIPKRKGAVDPQGHPNDFVEVRLDWTGNPFKKSRVTWVAGYENILIGVRDGNMHQDFDQKTIVVAYDGATWEDLRKGLVVDFRGLMKKILTIHRQYCVG